MTPQLRARLAGILYLIIFIAAPSGAKEATAARMLITLSCDVGVALLFYGLFKPFNRNLSFVAATFRLLFVAVMGANSLNYLGFLNLFGRAGSASAFDTVYGVSLVPFGVHCVAIGYLICQSAFLPRIIGVFYSLAGVGYLTFIWPPLGDRLFVPYIVVLAVLGEGSLTLWLTFMGVNASRWHGKAKTLDDGQMPATTQDKA